MRERTETRREKFRDVERKPELGKDWKKEDFNKSKK